MAETSKTEVSKTNQPVASQEAPRVDSQKSVDQINELTYALESAKEKITTETRNNLITLIIKIKKTLVLASVNKIK